MNTLIVDPSLEIDPRSLAERAGEMAARGSYSDAVALFRQALSFVPNNPQWHFQLAFAAWNAGDRDLAGHHFGRTARPLASSFDVTSVPQDGQEGHGQAARPPVQSPVQCSSMGAARLRKRALA